MVTYVGTVTVGSAVVSMMTGPGPIGMSPVTLSAETAGRAAAMARSARSKNRYLYVKKIASFTRKIWQTNIYKAHRFTHAAWNG
jgi:hypothetical protein